ncbi:hypothetical protein LTS15_006959 [Exophiala xenobiotica]|nr:hypothetical protein LTS15_006959 [Exophiala xenobiotica]
MPSPLTRPPYDPELSVILSKLPFTPTLTAADIPRVRKFACLSIEDVLAGRPGIEHEEKIIQGPDGGGELRLSVFRPMSPSSDSADGELRPAIYYTHGGGMIAGTRFLGIGEILDWVSKFKIVCVAVEYRLPPEHPHPAPVEDCYAGLLWMSTHAEKLGIDKDRIVVAGSSAGGGLAGGTTLLARDRGNPLLSLRGQMLLGPMLDDRGGTVSSRLYVDEGTWSRGSNELGWRCLLGEKPTGGDGDRGVSIYAAPSRATVLGDLPEAFIDVGAAEVFRDEAVAYANRVACWPGAWHGFAELAPEARLSVRAKEPREAWMRRVLIKQDV